MKSLRSRDGKSPRDPTLQLDVTDEAKGDISRAYISGAEQFGIRQAEAYAEGLNDTFKFLTNFPRAARYRLELRPPVYAYPYKAHIIVYDIGDTAITILRVRHAREDWVSDPL